MGTSVVNEVELWTRARADDGRAFASLFDQHRDRVFRHCLRLVENPHDAEEVTARNVARNVRKGTRRYRALLDALLVLVSLEGYTITDAAPLLGLSPGAARTRLHRAKNKLRERRPQHVKELP